LAGPGVEAEPVGEVVAVELGVELSGVEVVLDAEHLHGAGLAGPQDDGVGRQLGDGLLVGDEGLEDLRDARADRVGQAGLGESDLRGGDGLAIGGVLLIVPGLLMGGRLPQTTPLGITFLLLLIAISTLGFTLYNKLLTCNPVGKIAIYNSLIPIVGAVTSCLCLGEIFYIKYVIAGALAAGGIYLINK